MSIERKALEVLRVIAHMAAEARTVTIAEDWGLGTGVLVMRDGSHTQFGSDSQEDNGARIGAFVEGLHDLLVCNRGLSYYKGCEE